MNFQLDYSTKVILRVVVILLALGFLWIIRDIVIILLLALVLASAMEPVVDYLNRRRIPRSVSVLSAYVVVIAVVALITSLMAPIVIEQFQVLSRNLPQYAVEVQAKYPNLTLLFGGADLSTVAQKLFSDSTNTEAVFSRTLGLFNGLFALVTVLVVSFYLVAADRGMKKFVSDLLPPQHQPMITGLIEKIQHKMGLWVVGQIILSIFIFALTYLGLSILGVEYALFLA
ncbi:MAG: AI-2E family transporter, partial [bacterium]|nr:AI-2E family transporter [bacterium]